jgi:hypothetical protein
LRGEKTSFFEKKEAKKLWPLRAGWGRNGPTPREAARSFLVLFFKKELLPSSFLA